MYETMSDLNVTGISGLFQMSSEATLLFPIMLIVSIWAIVSLGNFYATIRRHNQAELLASLVVGGFVASIISGLCMLIPNFMPLYIVAIVVILEIVLAILLFADKNLKFT